jgi:hypothetical protein
MPGNLNRCTRLTLGGRSFPCYAFLSSLYSLQFPEIYTTKREKAPRFLSLKGSFPTTRLDMFAYVRQDTKFPY